MDKRLFVAIAAFSLASALALDAHAEKHKRSAARPVTTPAASIKWTPLVPELGDKGPKLAVVFGDLKKGPVGVLLKQPSGARPGPHTHTSDYWAVVVSGQLEAFEPGMGGSAARMPNGSWWMQPGKAAHDNHCVEGSECVMFAYFPKGFDFAPVPVKKAER